MIRRGAVVAPIHVDADGHVRLLWGKRNVDAPALAGFHVCPGGLLDEEDGPDGGEADLAARVCALRELFEEVDVLVAEGAERLDREARVALREALVTNRAAGEARFAALGLRWPTERLEPIGRWVTPPHAHRRFDTSFFALRVDEMCEPHPDTREITEAGWVEVRDALARWARGEVLLTPPTTALLRSLARHGALRAEELRAVYGAKGEVSFRWEVVPHVQMMSLRTPTLPPATHTNSYLIGSREAVIVEPATPYGDEQDRMLTWLEEATRDGIEPVAIFATHHHPDHVGGAKVFAERLGLPIWAHRLTAERLRGSVTIDRHIEDGETIRLDGPTPVELRAMHTPGHAPGHLCLIEPASGAMIAGDMVASVGTILVDTTDGDMIAYLASLERMRALAPNVLLPAHGMPIRTVHALLTHYIEHRLAREAKVVDALRAHDGPASASGLVPRAYDDAPRAVWPIATMSVEAHLEKLRREGRVTRTDAGWSAVD